jgi:glycosyltransferase involved in cell wall biosynthesis
MNAPRIALLVHNRLENDPRVSRHARAAVGAGYRAAVLSVGATGTHGARWGELVDGAAVYESRIVRVSLLGKARAALFHRRARKPVRPVPSTDIAVQEPGGLAGSAISARQVARDVATIAMLLRNNVGIFRQFRGIGARIVHANDLNVLPAGYMLARAWRAALLYDSHELWTQLDAEWSPLLRWLFARLEGPLLRRADAVVTVNGAIARELAQMYGAPEPIVVMNCPELPQSAAATVSAASPEYRVGVTPDDPGQTRSRSASRSGVLIARPPAATEPLAVIYQGVLDERGRGLEGLIDAVARLDGVRLTLRGPGARVGALQRRVEELGTANVRIVPPVPMADLVRALDGYDVGVVAYLPLGKNFLFCSPNKLFEYMMAGLAVVCSDLPVLREVVTTADCGLLYAPGNADSLAEALRRLTQDRTLLATYKANALRAAKDRYNATVEEGRLLAVYHDLLTGPGEHHWDGAR